MSRSYKTVLIVVLLIGLVAAFAVPAAADRDDTLLAGRANGAKQWNTSLYSTNNNATLSLYNKNGSGAPALALSSNSGPAMSITSTDKIVNLNSDYVDGYNANRLRVLHSSCASEGVGDPSSTSWSCAPSAVSLPGAGLADMTGSIDIYNYNTSDVDIYCRFQYKVDGGAWVTLTHSDRDMTIPGNDEGICATDGWYYTDTAINLQIRFQVHSIDANVTLGQSAMWWIYLPA